MGASGYDPKKKKLYNKKEITILHQTKNPKKSLNLFQKTNIYALFVVIYLNC